MTYLLSEDELEQEVLTGISQSFLVPDCENLAILHTQCSTRASDPDATTPRIRALQDMILTRVRFMFNFQDNYVAYNFLRTLGTLALLVVCLSSSAQSADRFGFSPSVRLPDVHGHEWVLVPASELYVYALAGGAGFDLPAGSPAGPASAAGFLLRKGGAALHGGTSYTAYYQAGQHYRYWGFEGGVGAWVWPEFAITANLAYYSRRGPEAANQGDYALTLRPILQLFPLSPRLNVTVSGSATLANTFFSFSGMAGIAYKLQ